MKSRILKYSRNRAEIELSFSKQVEWQRLKQLFSETHSHIQIL